MASILREMYYGNVNPADKQFVRNSKYGKEMLRFGDSGEYLDKQLKGEDKKQFETFSDSSGNILDITACEYFVEGFKLGTQIMIESLVTDDSPFRPLTEGE